MSPSSTRFDFRKSVSYDGDAKRRFHHHARAQLRKLAHALRLDRDSYDLRSNPGGIAVSGEVILHSDTLYVQASQPATNTGASTYAVSPGPLSTSPIVPRSVLTTTTRRSLYVSRACLPPLISTCAAHACAP